MVRASPRANFNSSRLIRLLAEFTGADAGASVRSIAERLSDWLDVTDAISFAAALNAGPAPRVVEAGIAGIHGSLLTEYAQVRAALSESIAADGVFRPGKARIKWPLPAPGAAPERGAEYTPYHRYYLAHQREMDANVGLLRAKVRTTMSGLSPALAEVAALDVAFAKAWSERERVLLATVPVLLEKRFAGLSQTGRAAPAPSPERDDAPVAGAAGGWLAVFCREMQQVLLAELEVRLQPVLGLIDALANQCPQPSSAAPPEGVKETRGGLSFP